jgi:hypothetical protein
MIESSSASSSLNAVNIRQATSGTRERTSRQTDTPVTIRQPNIEHGDAGAQRRNPGQCTGCSARLADHLNVRLGLQKAPDTPADDLMVVQDEHLDRLSQPTAAHGHSEKLPAVKIFATWSAGRVRAADEGCRRRARHRAA